MEGSFEECGEIDSFARLCLGSREDVKEAARALWRRSESVSGFVRAVLASDDERLYMSQGYGVLAERTLGDDAERAVEKMYRRILNTDGIDAREAKTVADAGVVAVNFGGVGALEIPNGLVDEECSVLVFDNPVADDRPAPFNCFMFQKAEAWFTVAAPATASIALCDCDPFGAQSDIRLAPGEYRAYSSNRRVFIERWRDA